MTVQTEPLTLVDQIESIANQELEPDYFQKRTREGTAEAAMQARIERDDRKLLVCYADESITEIENPEALYRTDEILGFAFFGTYTADEMDAYMEVPLEQVFVPDDFPAGHFRNLTIRGDAQGGPISSRMIGRIIEGLYELGQNVLVVLLRDRHDIDTPDYAEDFGAEQVGAFENYFDDRICTICESDCECTFVFYKMEIS